MSSQAASAKLADNAAQGCVVETYVINLLCLSKYFFVEGPS